MQCGGNVRRTKTNDGRNLSKEDLWARFLTAQWITKRAATGSSPACLQCGQTNTDEEASGDLPMGMTTPRTATVRFSPRRKFSLPAEGKIKRERGVRMAEEKDSGVREDEREKA